MHKGGTESEDNILYANQGALLDVVQSLALLADSSH